jgi:hypothetical protein
MKAEMMEANTLLKYSRKKMALRVDTYQLVWYKLTLDGVSRAYSTPVTALYPRKSLKARHGIVSSEYP